MVSDYNNRGGQGQRSSSDEGSALGADRLAQQLSEIARELQQEESLQDTLMGIVQAAVDNVPGAQFAGISVVEARRKVSTRAWTDEVVRACD
jgi:uncharacterized protein YigA (DUF484 family)